MLDLSSGPVEIKILSAGSNFLKVGSMISLGMTGYFGSLPKGSTVSVHTMTTGEACVFGPEMVHNGKYHMGITTPDWFVQTAYEGRGARGFGEYPLDIRAICVFPHFDQIAMAVRKDLGVTSLRQIIDQKLPLRISTAPTHLQHPTGWTFDLLFQEYGIEFEDFAKWGGSVTFGDRQPNFLEKVPTGRKDRVSAMQEGLLDAVFDEALMTLPWQQLADTVDLTFLSIDRDVLATLNRKYGIGQTVLPEGRLKGIGQGIHTIDFSGWILYCHKDLPDSVVEMALAGIEQQAAQMETLFRPGQGLTGSIDILKMANGLTTPLHTGAEAFFKRKGVLA